MKLTVVPPILSSIYSNLSTHLQPAGKTLASFLNGALSKYAGVKQPPFNPISATLLIGGLTLATVGTLFYVVFGSSKNPPKLQTKPENPPAGTTPKPTIEDTQTKAPVKEPLQSETHPTPSTVPPAKPVKAEAIIGQASNSTPASRLLPQLYGNDECILQQNTTPGLNKLPPLARTIQLQELVQKLGGNPKLPILLWAQALANLFEQDPFLLTAIVAFGARTDTGWSARSKSADLLEIFLQLVYRDRKSATYSDFFREALSENTILAEAQHVSTAIVFDALVIGELRRPREWGVDKKPRYEIWRFASDKKKEGLRSLFIEMGNLKKILETNCDFGNYEESLALIKIIHDKRITSFKTLISLLREEMKSARKIKENEHLYETIGIIESRKKSKAIVFES